MSAYRTLLYEVAEGIATITLNRPDRLNALSWELLRELAEALRAAEKDPAAHVVILKGAGRGFSAGYDLGHVEGEERGPGIGPADGREEPRGVPDLGRGVWNSRAHVQGHWEYERLIWELWKPVIAQVHGFALAGASTLALVCDLTISTKRARFGYPPVRWLSSGDTIALYSYLVPLKKAKEMSFGKMFSGEEGEKLGLVNYAFDDDALEAETRRIAGQIASVDPELLMINKMLVNRTWEIRGLQTAIAYGGELDTLSHMSNTGRPFFEALQRHGGDLAATLKELNLPWGGV